MRDQAADRLVGLAPCLVRLPLPNNSIEPPPLRFAPLAPCSASGAPKGVDGEAPPSGPAPPWHRPPPFVPRDPGAGQVYGRSPSGRTA